ncbi:MAG: hypothetical protein GY749_04550 [Desulfobacteraceae bacterium]|nr:hypothetical protein [Desulfobacteraceae bacterium]
MNDLSLADFFNILDILVMEQTDNGLFELAGGVPCNLEMFCPKQDKGFRPDENSLFLKNFLIDAESHWAEENPEKLKSGPWLEIDPAGNECAFEATAVFLKNRKILMIETARSSYEEKQFIIQKELSLAYHRLEQTEAELQKAKQVAEKANSAAFLKIVWPSCSSLFPRLTHQWHAVTAEQDWDWLSPHNWQI